jgi:CubicO group peptidase (beta-lactamase class C family)
MAMKTMKIVVLLIALITLAPVYGQETPTPSVNIHLAALQGSVDAINDHIRAGSDLNEKDAFGSTPLIIAATFGKTEVAKALIEAGADLEIMSNDGSAPIHIATFFGRTEIVKALLEKGANKYRRDFVGNTPLDIVAVPFEFDQDMYDKVVGALGPLGLELDYEHIKSTRPLIAEKLRPSAEELEAVDYTPLPGDDWAVSTPEEQGLDPLLVAKLYLDAAEMEKTYGLLIVKNDHLVAEAYFNEGSIEQKALLQSVGKSYTSALVGIAIEQGFLSGEDQKMMDFFPEFVGKITDPRKELITVRDLLQMRAGYPWEETTPELFDTLYNGFRPSHLIDFALNGDPGTSFAYSNLTSHLLAIIVARVCGEDFKSYAQMNLFSPLGVEVGEPWWKDWEGYYTGHAGVRFTLRDAAKFGILYLNDGEYAGNQIIPADWIRNSLQTYSESVSSGAPQSGKIGRYLRDIGYGYQWWSARVGDHHINYAAGHGGQLIVLLEDHDMVVVVTSDPFFGQHDSMAWKYEQANFNLVGKFIKSLPQE